jgi:hypothetical protein
VPIVLKSGNLNLLDPSGSGQACNGIALPLPFTAVYQNGHPTTLLQLPNKVKRTSVIAILFEAHNDVCTFKYLLCIFQKRHEPANKTIPHTLTSLAHTAHSEIRFALITGFVSDVHEHLYGPEPI